MKWNRSNAIGLASQGCKQCHGHGILLIRKETEAPCGCVLRAVFRACFSRFRECVALEGRTSSVSLVFCHGQEGRRNYAMQREEYMADFDLVSRRALDDFEYQIFRWYFMLGAEGNLCCRRLKMGRGQFYHHLYSVMEKLGRIYAEVRPYPLYPLDEYFGGMVKRKGPEAEISLNSVFGDFDRRLADLRASA